MQVCLEWADHDLEWGIWIVVERNFCNAVKSRNDNNCNNNDAQVDQLLEAITPCNQMNPGG